MSASLAGRKFHHKNPAIPRYAEACAEFFHPVTAAPMVTWYQTSDFRDEEPEFFSASRKEFTGWFPDEI